jgi:hypothetical protein
LIKKQDALSKLTGELLPLYDSEPESGGGVLVQQRHEQAARREAEQMVSDFAERVQGKLKGGEDEVGEFRQIAEVVSQEMEGGRLYKHTLVSDFTGPRYDVIGAVMGAVVSDLRHQIAKGLPSLTGKSGEYSLDFGRAIQAQQRYDAGPKNK